MSSSELSSSTQPGKSKASRACPHCERPYTALPVMDKRGDPRLIRTWRSMAPKLTADERERFDELLTKSRDESCSLTEEEGELLGGFDFQDELANTVQSYVLCQGCFSLEDALFFAAPKRIRDALAERGW